MATPENTLITRAEVTSITNATTGRKALVLDGTTLELGNTGLRDLSGLFVAGRVSSGRVLVQRVGNQVTWTLVSLNLPSTVTSVWNILINSGGQFDGFKPPQGIGVPLMQGKNEFARFMVNASGTVDVHYATGSLNYPGVVTYTTNAPWPTTLPGVADGQPVSV